jgi:hypothetical protein
LLSGQANAADAALLFGHADGKVPAADPFMPW